MIKLSLRPYLSFFLFALIFCGRCAFAAPTVSLAAGGKSLQPIIVAGTASPKIKQLAATLADYLGKISGAKFEVKTGDGQSGLAVGVATDFPALNLGKEFAPTDSMRREEYLLRSHDGGVYLVGATEQAVSHSVWDFLFRLGYRQFFPGKHWEVIPKTPDLKIEIDAKESPDYYARRIWYGFGDWPDNGADKVDWDARNRMGDGLAIRAGHAWDKIYNDRKAEFNAHPEYLVSQHPVKFCVSNPGLRKLVADWAVEQFDKDPNLDSVSLEPSDGDGWDSAAGTNPDAVVYKTITDRVVTLANETAEAVNKKYPGKFVVIYAYFKHSPPPTIRVNPQVAVGVATAFSAGFEKIVPGWVSQGATAIGIRDYYSVVINHKDRPGGVPAGDARGVAAAITKRYAMQARFMSAESSDSWGPAGLGYYTASRLLWDTHANPDDIINDFFGKAFGPAQKPMRDFYNRIDPANRPLFSSDLVGRMYRDIDAARLLTSDAGIRGRLDDLTLYTRYAELLENLSDETAMGAALTHAYRIRRTHMVHSLALWRDTRGWPTVPQGDTVWNVPEGKNPWKNSAPFSEEEITKIISDGIANNQLMSFTPVAYGHELVPATPLQLKTPGQTGNYGYSRPAHRIYLWVDKAPATIQLTVTGGQVGVGGNSSLELYATGNPTGALLDRAEVPNDRQPHQVELKTTFPGLHQLEIRTQRAGTFIKWPDGLPASFASSIEEPTVLSHRIDMYFYVPKGTKVVGGFAQGVGILRGADNKTLFTFGKDEFNRGNYFSVPVPPGQDGKLWQFAYSAGPRLLMTVPPYLARNGNELLLPKEVVEADSKN